MMSSKADNTVYVVRAAGRDVEVFTFDNLDAVRLSTSVNGEVLQDTTLNNLVFDFPAIIRSITASTPLSPGDLVVSSAPGGVGVVAHPPRFLSPGDVTEVEVTGVGVLRHEIVEPVASR